MAISKGNSLFLVSFRQSDWQRFFVKTGTYYRCSPCIDDSDPTLARSVGD